MHDRKANRKSRTKSVATVRRNSFTVDPNAPPVPTLRPSVGKNNTEAHTPLLPSNKEACHADPTDAHSDPVVDVHSVLVIDAHSVPVVDVHPDSRAVPPTAQNNGPRVVVITPPGSPKDRSFSYEDLESSAKSSDTSDKTTTSRTTTSRWRRRRVLVIANPDEDSDLDKHRKFVFNPPPLPETSRRIISRSYSSGPRPSSKLSTLVAAKIAPPVSPPSSQRSGSSSSSIGSSSLSLTTTHKHPNASKDKSETDASDDSDTDEDLHLWNKPPIDLHKAPKLASASSPALAQTLSSTFQPSAEAYTLNTHTIRAARKSKSMKARQSIRPHSWLVRPDVQEVLDDLPNFFPDQDVGQAKVQDTTCQAPSKRQTGEIPHPFRRVTRLLRSYSGEPKT
ncbi:hypothetical protein M378DRAFT_499416 [Amanita muscaria Koide BX008]|uniref:Uncharacterized protein n=1 Tax=Amanita muscaria (strain Koide BX008) TaxID=946122 RepID=A0A0C2XMW5_AMAMK|nr:hypothetical protein M378DRAFT_499416 [Amanita muscaria Koide BX008]